VSAWLGGAWYPRRVERGGIADAELVRRIAGRAGGAREAEAEMCRRFAPRIRLYGLRHLRDEDRARDLVQAVLLAVLDATRAGRVEDHERFDRFVLGTCRHVAGRVREQGARHDAADGDDDAIARATAHGADPVDRGALMHCLHALEERARTVVYLSFRVGHDAATIATMLATTSGNVRVVRHRALAALRRCLDGEEEVG
jgi:RNA polymerase sigma-70 factor (ECF subfamily)